MELAGRAALVTGAGRRLGRAIAVGLARAGCDVGVHYHASAADAETTAMEIRATGRRAELLAADLRDVDTARALAPRAASAFGRLDVLVNSAAVMVRQPVEEVTAESWDATFDLNVRACFFVSQGALPALRAAKGKIVNLADIAAFEPWPAYIPHGASKAAVVMLTKGLAKALAPDVAVNAVAPGPVLVPDDWDAGARERLRAGTPLGRLGEPEDAVRAVLFLLSGTDFVTGTVLVVDGGRMIR